MGFKLQKVTNPEYVGIVAPLIKKFVELTNIPGMTYESLYTYYTSVVRMQGNEFYVVLDMDGMPVAFGNWQIRGIPYIGNCYFHSIYKSVKSHAPVDMLVKRYIDYGLENKCPFYDFDAANIGVAETLAKIAERNGLDVTNAHRAYFHAKFLGKPKNEDLHKDSDKS